MTVAIDHRESILSHGEPPFIRSGQNRACAPLSIYRLPRHCQAYHLEKIVNIGAAADVLRAANVPNGERRRSQ
jgi:hypothetical protein